MKYDENRKLTIKEWCVQDRPREKYVKHGASSLSDAELIAILLRTGNVKDTAVELAKKLLINSNNSLNELSTKSLQELSKVKGIGSAKAVSLLVAFEIGKRVRSEKVEQNNRIDSPNDVLELMQDKIAYRKHEEFWVIYLNHSNLILKVSQISKGGITNAPVDIRIILHEALNLKATSMLLSHNHPSGNLQPSKADIEVTKKIRSAAAMMDISLIDHVIVFERERFSFVENSIVPFK